MDPHVSRSKLKDGKTKVTVKRQLFPNILWKAKSKIKSVKIRECGYERSVKRANSMNHEIFRTRSRESDAFATHFQHREASIHVAKKSRRNQKGLRNLLGPYSAIELATGGSSPRRIPTLGASHTLSADGRHSGERRSLCWTPVERREKRYTFDCVWV